MSRFPEALSRARQQLEINEPARSRVLLEMANDLEDSYQHFLTQGLGEAEAKRRAEESFAVSDQALQHLARIHETGLHTVSDGLSEHVGGLWQKILILMILAFEILLAARILTDRTFFLFLSPFVWPIAAMALAAFLFTVWKLYQIFSTSEPEAYRYRSGLWVLLWVAACSVAVAGTGFLFHLQRFLRMNYDTSPESLFMNFAGFALGISSLMTIGFLTAIFAALVWFILISLVAHSERRGLEHLLEGQP